MQQDKRTQASSALHTFWIDHIKNWPTPWRRVASPLRISPCRVPSLDSSLSRLKSRKMNFRPLLTAELEALLGLRVFGSELLMGGERQKSSRMKRT